MEITEQDRSTILDKLSDRWWRLNNLYWIVDKWGNKVRFKPNEVQTSLDDELHNLNIVPKSRQHGITTWACIRALDMALFRSNCRCGIVAHTAGDAASFFRKKVLYAYDNLPDWLKRLRPPVRRDMRDGALRHQRVELPRVGIAADVGVRLVLQQDPHDVLVARRLRLACAGRSGRSSRDAAISERRSAEVQQRREQSSADPVFPHVEPPPAPAPGQSLSRAGCCATCRPARNPNTMPFPRVPPPLGYAQPKTLAAVFPAAYKPPMTPPPRQMSPS